jgi:hypothetical protein
MEFVNTVPAADQMINSATVSHLGKKDAPLRILVLGNSITRHGPKEDIGWPYDWGMAASSADKDYVHRLYLKLLEDGKKVYMRIRQASAWEISIRGRENLNEYEEDRDFGADIVVWRLGENVKGEDFEIYEESARKFLEYLAPDKTKIIFTTCFWANKVLDPIAAKLSKEWGAKFVNTSHTDEKMMALGLFEHQGVAGHPGDFGMEMIADKIFSAMKEEGWI